MPSFKGLRIFSPVIMAPSSTHFLSPRKPIETDEKEMNMKNETIPCLHYPMLKSVLLKVKDLLVCNVCLIVEMVVAIVIRLHEYGIHTVPKPYFLPFGDRMRNQNATIPLCGVSSRVMLVFRFFCRCAAPRGRGNTIRAGC